MAIAWEESTAGKYRVNLNSHDFGVMQNSLKTAKIRTKTKGYYATMSLVEKLIKDDDLSMSLALEELLYWRKQTGSWRHTVSAYNNGWAYDKGSVYLTSIIKYVNMFQRCGGIIMDKDLYEYLVNFDAQHPMPKGANQVFYDREGRYRPHFTMWRKDYVGLKGFYFDKYSNWMPHCSTEEGRSKIVDIPLEFLMEKYLE